MFCKGTTYNSVLVNLHMILTFCGKVFCLIARCMLWYVMTFDRGSGFVPRLSASMFFGAVSWVWSLMLGHLVSGNSRKVGPSTT